MAHDAKEVACKLKLIGRRAWYSITLVPIYWPSPCLSLVYSLQIVQTCLLPNGVSVFERAIQSCCFLLREIFQIQLTSETFLGRFWSVKMATETFYFKQREGRIVHNPMGQLSAPWWSAITSPSVYGEACGQLKPLSIEHPSGGGGDQLITNKQAARGTEQATARANTTQFTLFPDNCRSSGDGQKSQAAISLQSALPRGCFELGFGQPMIYAKYPYGDQCYGVFPTSGPQIPDRVMLPLNMTTDDGPTYVNAKQYHGIIRRRQSRAKAVLENKFTRVRKPYMHESRHLHAMRRPRGCGGRFLNKGKNGTEVNKTGDGQISQATVSQSSEVLQSDSGALNTSMDANGSGSNISVSEVTSMFSRGDLDRFPINHLVPSVHSLSGRIDGGHGIVMPGKWVAAVDNCCSLKV